MFRPLTAPVVLPRGPLHRIGRQLHLFPEIDSTNRFLLERSAGLPDGTVALAEFQTAGRGRLGRQWHAPRGSSLLMSCLLHEPAGSSWITHGALLASVAVCRAVARSTPCRPGVRWPNDLVIGDRKVAGVLAETTPCGGGRAVVVGIGLNVYQQAGHFPGELRDKATSLELASTEPIDRGRVARALLEELDRLARLGGDAWAAARGAWARRCADLGQPVRLRHDGAEFAGVIRAVDENGDLTVELEKDGVRRFAATTTTRLW